MNYDVNRNGYWFSKEQLDEHDKQIRADAIEECIAKIDILEQLSFGIVATELVKGILEQLKTEDSGKE